MSQNIILYASDHGFGHATRMMALAEALHHAGAAVTLCAGAAAVLAGPALGRLAAAGRPPPEVVRVSLDMGLVGQAGTMAVDEEQSRAALSAWLRGLPGQIAREADRLRDLGADLVIADAPAAAVAAAARAGVPAVLCSNFNWLDVYGDRFGGELQGALREAYQGARLGLRLSPGRMPLQGLRRLREVPGVLGRRPRRDRAAVRAELGAGEGCLLLGVGLGRSFAAAHTAHILEAPGAGTPGRGPQVRLVVPSPERSDRSLALALAGVLTFPADTLDAQDYFGACDAVLGKAGYSTIAEAALQGVPLLLFPVPGNAESFALAAEAEAHGLALALADESAARQVLRDPAPALARARAGYRGPAPDAAPAVISALVEEGLLLPGMSDRQATL